MEQFTVNSIGRFEVTEQESRIVLEGEYVDALEGIEGFGSLNVLWWFSHSDNDSGRKTLQELSPYKKGPERLGVFATRSPQRPNPIALSCVQVTYVDRPAGIIGIAYTDAFDGSPVLDMKPYTPSLDRVEKPEVPQWCAHWPGCIEDSGDFDWGGEFNF